MPSNNQTNSHLISIPEKLLSEHILFFPILFITVGAWFAYRWLFSFPVWFDETVGKAVFFGLPVWFYLVTSKSKTILKPLRFSIIQPGLLLGLAMGGLFGFITSTMNIFQSGGVVASAQLFQSTLFWYEFALAIFTGFWETLFFYCFVAVVVFEKFKYLALVWQMIIIVVVFLLFHLPNAFLRFSPELVASQMLILLLFSLGQALVFYRWRNAYALMLSQAIWGLVLLFHGT